MTSTAADDSGSLQSKFQHLLQPIRDLAQNWNIDIAQDLENYLDQLDDIQVSVDGGQSLVNFAEAALLIQGSACVYSRKVDLLSHLVQHVLDIIFSRKRPDAALDLNVPVAPEGGTEGDFFTAEPEFLALDHVIQGKDTLMKDVNGPSAASAVLPSRAVLGLVTIDGDGSTGMKRASILSQCTPFRMGAMVVDRLLGASLDAAGYNRMSADTSAIAHVPSTPFPAEEQVAQALNFSDSGDMGDGAGLNFCNSVFFLTHYRFRWGRHVRRASCSSISFGEYSCSCIIAAIRPHFTLCICFRPLGAARSSCRKCR
jgi:condensin-2 complex subunit H2